MVTAGQGGKSWTQREWWWVGTGEEKGDSPPRLLGLSLQRNAAGATFVCVWWWVRALRGKEGKRGIGCQY